jgi:hypothetical protein
LPRTVRALAVTGTVVALAGAVGCGGGGSSPGPSSSPSPPAPPKIVSKASYVAQGDAICRDLKTKLDALQSPSNENDGKALAAYLRQGAALAESAVNQLDAVGRPATDAATAQRILDEQRAQVAKARQIATVFDNGDLAGGSAQIEAQDDAAAKLRTDAKAFGFKVCGT